jgi:hypothetical protein
MRSTLRHTIRLLFKIVKAMYVLTLYRYQLFSCSVSFTDMLTTVYKMYLFYSSLRV